MPTSCSPDNTPDSLLSGDQPDQIRPGRLMGSVLLLAFVADWLLYGIQSPGLALSLLSMTFGAVILWNRSGWTEDRGLLLVAPLALLAVVQAALFFSWINVVVLFLLLTALAGTRFSLPWAKRWPGWLEALVAWHKSPAHWVRANAALRAHMAADAENVSRGKWLRAGKIVLPGLILLVLFGALLGAGNALAGKYIGEIWGAVAESIRGLLAITPLRLLFWGVALTAALALCYPARCGNFVQSCTADWRRFSLSSDRGVALWQTWISLAVLNALFLFVNTLDVLYLWMRAELPPGVGYSSFVHEGVFALIASTVLAGVVLSFFFQQSAEVTRSKLARGLAVAWIAQNLLLLSGVAIRLHLYVDAFGWSVLRFHVGSFLILTTAGFGLLAIYVVKRLTLRWLVLANLAAVFCLIYLLQFVNVNGWVARSNVERWLAGVGPELDVWYIDTLGPAAWPALMLAVEEGPEPVKSNAMEVLAGARTNLEYSGGRRWQSWQWRTAHWEKMLRAQE